MRKGAAHAQRHQQPALGTDAWQSWLAETIRKEGLNLWQFGVTVEQLEAYQVRRDALQGNVVDLSSVHAKVICAGHCPIGHRV